MTKKQNPIKNNEIVKNLKQIADNHIIGGNLKFEGTRFLFIFHCEHFQLGGIQSRIITTKKEALTLLITRLDEFYNKLNCHIDWHTPLNSLTNN